jgi:AcrR family transcriptional regulator
MGSVNEPTPRSPRDVTRARLIEVAAELLATEGPDAVTTRSVALAAGVQAPSIYRLFGDKTALLDAVAEYGFEAYLAQKPPVDDGNTDPVVALRAGWDLHIGFGLANPALFRLMNTTTPAPGRPSAAETGGQVLSRRVLRVARAGRLRVPEHRAVELIRAAGTGVVFILIDQPAATRDETLADLAWNAVCTTILTGTHPTEPTTPAAAAITLRAALPDLPALTPNERALLGDWLHRIADA